jgi:hypothetical protein
MQIQPRVHYLSWRNQKHYGKVFKPGKEKS